MTTTYILCTNSSDGCTPICASIDKNVLIALMQQAKAADVQDQMTIANLSKDDDDIKLMAYMDWLRETHPLSGYLNDDDWVEYLCDDNPNKLFIKSLNTL